MKNSRGSLMRPDALPESASHPVVTPLVSSVVYASQTPDMLDAQYDGQMPGFTYSREGHPNATVLARRIDRLEGAPQPGMVTGSGMAAVTAVLMGLLKPGDHVLASDQLYGRSLRMLSEDLPRLGIETSLVDTTDAGAIAGALRPDTRIVMAELVSNPTLRVADVVALKAAAEAQGAYLVIDNTFTTPRGFRPFDHGADMVIHSVTKLLAGHADVLLGYVAARDAEVAEALEIFAVTTGMTASPFECWLAERGLLSFELRYDRAEATCKTLADALAAHPKVRRVIYPGRADHPDADRARALLGERTGNVVSFEIAPNREAANAFCRAAEGLSFAPTLGDVGTTVSHPASSSHRALSPEARAELGISEGFFRISVGLEDPDALWQAFEQGLAAAPG